MKSTVYNKLPTEIKGILLSSKGWLVGRSIENLINGQEPKDFDIIIDANNYINIFYIIKEYYTGFNTYGGYRLDVKGYIVDIWVEDLEHFLLVANNFTYAYNLRKNILLKNQD